MTSLRIYDEDAPEAPRLSVNDGGRIHAILADLGVLFERWTADAPLAKDARPETVLATYAPAVERLKRERGYQSADVARIPRGAPDAASLRARFLNEHTHSEDEARFFVEGTGAFYLHLDRRVLVLECEAGDLLSVPAGTRHWFDMGADPHFTAIRFFTRPDGWVADVTGDTIAERFPKHTPSSTP